ncbi:MAG: phosphate-selective porin [Planctomycetota bacterium]|jgi:phosphate-selective porin
MTMSTERALFPLLCLTLVADSATSQPETIEEEPVEQTVVAGPQVDYDDGFRIRSLDGRSEFKIEGLFQSVFGLHQSLRQPSNDMTLKRMRPEFVARVDGSLHMKLEPKFTENEVELEEAWVGTDLAGGDARLMIGRMKAPFNLEEVRSRRHIAFPFFSLINQFAPAEDHGVFVNGHSSQGSVEWGIAAYNGTGDSDTTSSKDVAARVMLHPCIAVEGSALQNIQVGIAATLGKQSEDIGETTIETETGLPVMTFLDGVMLDGRRLRAGFESAWFHGPWFAQAEIMHVEQRMSADGGAPMDIEFRGAYLSISHVLTGESISFGGVSPESAHDFASSAGRGAWVLAARASVLEIDEEVAGLVGPGQFTDRIDSYSLGLNWIPSEHLIIRNSVVHSRYANDVVLDNGATDSETSVIIEVQMHF